MAGDVTMDAQTKPRTEDPTIIDGLEFPFADYPAPGSATEVANGIFWVSTPVPFVGLKQVNLWLLRDGDGWTMIDCGYVASERKIYCHQFAESVYPGDELPDEDGPLILHH